MKALVFENGGARFAADYPVPVPGPGESLIKISLAAVCSTDKEVLKGYKPDFSGVMGHEFVGVAVSSPDPSLAGRRVVGELNAGCGACLYCKTGRERHCERRKVIGLAGKDGCFAEYMTLRTDLLHLVPDGLPDEAALFAEPLAAALEIAEENHIRPTHRVAVVGDGRLAYLAAQVLSLTGASLTVVGKHPGKLAAFAPFADITTEPAGSFDVVVEASGKPEGLATAMGLVRHTGLIVLKSTYAGDTAVSMSNFVVNEVRLAGSRCGPFAPALRLLARGLVTLPPVELYPLEQWEAAFSSKAFKAGFTFKETGGPEKGGGTHGV